MTDRVLATVFRYDPATDVKPYYKVYEIPWKQYLSVLEVLVYIYEEYEGIAFDYGCRGIWCGRCGVMVDGKPVLACMSPVNPGKITIEPLKNLPVIRDLVVDRGKIKSKLHSIMPYLRREKPMEEMPSVSFEAYEKMCGLYRCTECMLCYTVCPVINDDMDLTEFCGPAALLKIALRFYDPRDEADRVAQAVEEGLGHCTMCGLCHDVCYLGTESVKDLPNSFGPSELFYIDHLAVFEDLRKAAKGRGLLGKESGAVHHTAQKSP
ncbi:MAG: 2Fe-2S iron-sulfur cluster-binding protein [Dehalococcoidia bacterium]|nr:2Fe-2S iron-sulfur cluster-binding protein [Dehalococcoidia bacterium]